MPAQITHLLGEIADGAAIGVILRLEELNKPLKEPFDFL